jgi:hypothetical protein
VMSPIAVLRRILEVLTLGPCGPLIFKHATHLANALKAINWQNLDRAKVRAPHSHHTAHTTSTYAVCSRNALRE